jgi:hypothetical protein
MKLAALPPREFISEFGARIREVIFYKHGANHSFIQ